VSALHPLAVAARRTLSPWWRRGAGHGHGGTVVACLMTGWNRLPTKTGLSL